MRLQICDKKVNFEQLLITIEYQSEWEHTKGIITNVYQTASHYVSKKLINKIKCKTEKMGVNFHLVYY